MSLHVAFRDVGVAYGDVWAVEHIDLRIERGEVVGIVGPSGAGKTTLLRLLLGELTPTRGQVTFATTRVARATRRRAIGYVPQLDASERSFPLTVQGAVELGAAARSARVPWFTRAERAAALAALDRLGIADLAHRGLHELSGGQFQRVLFARALVAQPDVLLLDEPTSGIDLQTRIEMLGVVEALRRDGLTIIMTTHDLNWVAAHLPRIVCLNQRIRADGDPRRVLRPDVLLETFGAEMQVIEHAGRPIIVDPVTLVGG